MRIEDLSQWVENDDARYAVVQENNSRETFVKIPYDEDFDFIYHQRGHHGNSLSRNQAFYYCGLYNKLDGMVYDLQNPLKGNLSDLDSGKTIRTLQDEFEAAVRSFINNIVDNNVDNLRSPFFENESYQQKLDHFKEYYAEAVIRQKFLDGESAEDVKFQCDYDCGRFEESQDCLEKLEAKEDTRFHRQRNISKAINESGAKSVNVTIQRDGKDFTFKYPAFNLGCNAYMDYHSWDMSAKDRENFRNMFEEGSRFYPQEITAISYRGKTIYEAEPWGVEDIPDEAETNTMKM